MSERDLLTPAVVVALVSALLRSSNPLPLRGTDAYYHLRNVRWTMANWPETLSYDPWTNFPTGTTAGQFGTPFDLVVATTAMLSPLGPVETLALVPAVLGGAASLIAFAAGRELYDDRAGLAAAITVVLVPGTFMMRTTGGFGDHHAAEVVLQAGALVLAMAAMRRDRWLTLSVTSGLVLALYVLVWPPGILLAGVYIAFCGLLLTPIQVGFERGRAGSVVSVSTAIAAVALLPFVGGPGGVVNVGLIHVAALGGVSCAGAFARGPDKVRYAAFWSAVAAGVLTLLAVPAVASMVSMALAILTPGTTTPDEAKPGVSATAFIVQSGLLAAMGLGAAYWLKRSPERLLAGLWLLSAVALAIAQVRWHYYIAVPAAALAAAGLVAVADSTDLRKPAVAAAVVLLALGPGLAIGLTEPVGGGGPEQWRGSLDWVREETPDPGMDYDGHYENHWEPPERSYSVAAWWPYGHWITEIARRPAFANPMQEGAMASSEWLSGMRSAPESAKYAMVSRADATSRLPDIMAWAGVDACDRGLTLEARDSNARKLYFGKHPGWEVIHVSEETVETYPACGGEPSSGPAVIVLERAD